MRESAPGLEDDVWRRCLRSEGFAGSGRPAAADGRLGRLADLARRNESWAVAAAAAAAAPALCSPLRQCDARPTRPAPATLPLPARESRRHGRRPSFDLLGAASDDDGDHQLLLLNKARPDGRAVKATVTECGLQRGAWKNEEEENFIADVFGALRLGARCSSASPADAASPASPDKENRRGAAHGRELKLSPRRRSDWPANGCAAPGPLDTSLASPARREPRGSPWAKRVASHDKSPSRPRHKQQQQQRQRQRQQQQQQQQQQCIDGDSAAAALSVQFQKAAAALELAREGHLLLIDSTGDPACGEEARKRKVARAAELADSAFAQLAQLRANVAALDNLDPGHAASVGLHSGATTRGSAEEPWSLLDEDETTAVRGLGSPSALPRVGEHNA